MSIAKSEFESVLKLDSLFFKQATVKRESLEANTDNITLKFKHQIDMESYENISVDLYCILSGDDERFELTIDCHACFQYEVSASENYPEELVKSICEKNTLAIMFPYVRSQITLLTSQPGMEPIMLPPINIVSYLENQEPEC